MAAKHFSPAALARASWNWLQSERGRRFFLPESKSLPVPTPTLPEHQDIQRQSYPASQGTLCTGLDTREAKHKCWRVATCLLSQLPPLARTHTQAPRLFPGLTPGHSPPSEAASPSMFSEAFPPALPRHRWSGGSRGHCCVFTVLIYTVPFYLGKMMLLFHDG